MVAGTEARAFDIQLCLSSWPIQRTNLVCTWIQDGWEIWGRCVRPEMRFSFYFGVHTNMFQAETFVILTCTKECIGRAYTGEYIYIC
jgi:hypothetical protein